MSETADNRSLKDFALRWSRRLGVLGLVEQVYARRQLEAWEERNRKYRERKPNLNLPPPELIQRTYGTPSFSNFIDWGRMNADDIAALIRQHQPTDNPRVAEWGCGLGRIARHLIGEFDYTGFDIDQSSIDWCKEHLDAAFFLNELEPPLPTEDASFDVVFAVSIFTHLSLSAHEAWRDEILRVLRPGGVFLFTVHGEEQSKALGDREKRRFDRGELVVRGGVAEGSRTYLAYHPQPFVESVMMRGFEALGDAVQACGHTLYVARKPAA